VYPIHLKLDDAIHSGLAQSVLQIAHPAVSSWTNRTPVVDNVTVRVLASDVVERFEEVMETILTAVAFRRAAIGH